MLVLVVGLLVVSAGMAEISGFNYMKQMYNLDTDKLMVYEYQTAVRTLLKLKANKLLTQSNELSGSLYRACVRDARTLPQLAQCVVRLMDGPDEVALQNEDNPIITIFNRMRTEFAQFARRKRETERESRRTDWSGRLGRRRGLGLEHNEVRKKSSLNWPESLRKLRRLQDYIKKAEFCQNQVREMSAECSRYFSQLNMSTTFATQTPSMSSAFDQIVGLLNSDQFFRRLSILSPRVLSLFPRTDKDNPSFLSPDLLSLHGQGFFPLQDVFKAVLVDDNEMLQWTDFLIQVSGAAKQIDDIFAKNKHEIEFVENQLYPKVLAFKDRQKQWQKFRDLQSDRQKRQLDLFGYSYLSASQSRAIFGDYQGYDMLNSRQREAILEEKIRQIAKLNVDAKIVNKMGKSGEFRIRRQAEPLIPGTNMPESPDFETHVPELLVLTPWALEQRVGGFIVFEGIVLSPHAFTSEIVSPEAFTFHVLSPRAFLASVLSPMSFIARILGPTAFMAEVLSPQFFAAYVLTPEALVAEVLTPKFFDLRVASPKALQLQVLAPNILSPHINSPEYLSLYVLSPSIISPHIISDGRLNIEVLSPHLLSGHGLPGHDDEEAHHNSPEHHHDHGDNAFDHLLDPHGNPEHTGHPFDGPGHQTA